jgi:hypothetical protein
MLQNKKNERLQEETKKNFGRGSIWTDTDFFERNGKRVAVYFIRLEER